MVDNETTLTIKEVDARLSELISDMTETGKRELLERLEKWTQSKFEDARKHPRKQTSIYAVCSGHECYLRDYITDISAGGLFIETDSALFLNQELVLTFFLPDAGTPIKIKGKVVRSDAKGFGIKFDELLPNI
ncbi:MAG: PilZ domain-containing protein [Desulfobacterales bacterium]|nr:MAG: PilZ domain-containing protein [Desulfobacterales bacterium]